MLRKIFLCVPFVLLAGFFVQGSGSAGAEAATIRVPGEEPTIQAAVDAAQNGDVVLVAPGRYREQITLSGKTITLASQFLTTGDRKYIKQTILDGRIGQGDSQQELDPVVMIAGDVGPGTKITGFTVTHGDHGITCEGSVEIVHNLFVDNGDAIDYEGGGGLCAHNVFENNSDDGVDLDGPCQIVVEHNVIRNNGDDGIEARLHEYSGPLLTVIIRENYIAGNEEDGIQLIDYPDVSDRVYRIERNFILDNAMAGIGCMSDGNTEEDYQAADLPEPVYVINNTIVGNEYGITGGDQFFVVNNIIAQTAKTALKQVDGKSVLSHNLLWLNGTDDDAANVDRSSTLAEDPLLDKNHRPKAGSPCIDAGIARFQLRGKVLVELPKASYTGSAPDMGAAEWGAKD